MHSINRFSSWLTDNGSLFSGCKIAPCSKTRGGGYGIFSSTNPLKAFQAEEQTLMGIPLHLTWSILTCVQDPLLGTEYHKLLVDEKLDDRTVLIIHLLVEKLRGKDSFYFPYISVLPPVIKTPVCFSDEELEELQGTALYDATAALKNSAERKFENSIKPEIKRLLQKIAIRADVRLEDYLWCHSVFWSRAVNLPIPQPFLSEVPALSPGPSVSPGGDSVFYEALIPGIDFCNHDFNAGSLWDVDPSSDSVVLVAGPSIPRGEDSEVLISYGDKGNEELLFAYGFAVEDNPWEFVMLNCSKERFFGDCNEELGEFKLNLISLQSLSLRWLLRCSIAQSMSATGSDSQQVSVSEAERQLSDCISCLRVAAMDEQHLLQVSAILEKRNQEGSWSTEGREIAAADIEAATKQVCGDVDALQLLRQLLLEKLERMEDRTGIEESDRQKLDSSTTGSMSSSVRFAIVYRMGQKKGIKLWLHWVDSRLDSVQL